MALNSKHANMEMQMKNFNTLNYIIKSNPLIKKLVGSAIGLCQNNLNYSLLKYKLPLEDHMRIANTFSQGNYKKDF